MGQSPYSTDLFAADLNEDTVSLDLHGLNRDEAVAELKLFLKAERKFGNGSVRIIHGRGDGILHRAVHDLLTKEKQAGNILDFRDSERPARAGGMTIAILNQKTG